MDGMTSLIKSIFIVLLSTISACSLIDTKDIKRVFTNDYIVISEKELSELKNKDFNIVRINDSNEHISLLNEFQSINSKKYMLSNDRTYSVLNGKIIKTYGFNNDINIKNYKDLMNNLPEIEGKKTSALIRFSNRSTSYLSIYYEYEIINDTSHKQKRLNKDDNFILVEERFFIPIIKWRGKNYYVFDVNNQILESQQMLAPFGNYITIKYK